MSTATAVPLSEYLETCNRPDCEYLDGILLERNVGEWDHSRLQIALGSYFFTREKLWRIVAVSEQRIQVRATRFRASDISVLIRPAPGEPILKTPPFLCIDILSPSDRMAEMHERIDDNRRAFVYTTDQVREVKDGVLCTENPAICVPLFDVE